MADHSEGAALERPAEDPTGLLAAREPSSIRDALDVHVRLDALSSWVDDRKRDVRRWVAERADLRREEDGAAPTWRLGDDVGTVLQTDPQPTPRISDPEAFARWYVEEVLADDPDREPEDGYLVRFDDDVVRHTVATCPSDALLRWLDDAAELEFDDANRAAEITDRLTGHIDVDEQWHLSGDLLDRMLEGKAAATDDGKARIAVVEGEVSEKFSGWRVIDRESGETVPGITVAAAGARQVQMKPSSALKASVREELDALIGPAKLGQEGTTDGTT